MTLHRSSVVANFLLKVTTNHFFQIAFTWSKGTKDLVCLAWQRMCTSTEGQKTFARGTSIQTELKIKHHCSTDWRNKFLFSKLQHSKQCRQKRVKYHRSGRISLMQWHTPPMSQCISPYSAFHVSNPQISRWIFFFFFRGRPWYSFSQPWKLEFEPLNPTCCCLLKLVQGGWMLGCVGWPTSSFPRGKELGGRRRRSTRSASLPWRSAASRRPAM